MWVEADTNVTGGESLVRQILYGKRFFRHEFGVDVRYLWLPDVFGYSGPLPQILTSCRRRLFLHAEALLEPDQPLPAPVASTGRASTAREVLAHMLPEETYNSPAAPRSVRKIERNYQDKGVSAHALLVFGIGDGGGGPGEEHLERLARITNLDGPAARDAGAGGRLLRDVGRRRRALPHLGGRALPGAARGHADHQGAQQALQPEDGAGPARAGMEPRAGGPAGRRPYPAERLEAIWREMLLYQFHDILPGSSIKRVYDESAGAL